MTELNTPKLESAPKIESVDDFLRKVQDSGIFAEGLNFQDFCQGITIKRTIIIEDNHQLREEIRKYFEPSALKPFCAQDYQTAKRLIYPRFPTASKFSYAIVDDHFPDRRDENPQFLADTVVDELVREHPGIRIFGYFEREKNVDQSKYIRILTKDDVPLDRLYKIIIHDAESTTGDNKKDDNGKEENKGARP